MGNNVSPDAEQTKPADPVLDDRTPTAVEEEDAVPPVEEKEHDVTIAHLAEEAALVKHEQGDEDLKNEITEEDKDNTEDATSALIAQAAAAAVEAAAQVDLDVTLAADAAVLAVEQASKAAAAAAEAADESFNAKKNEQRRKRYREKAVEEQAAAQDGSVGPSKKKALTHEEQLAARRMKDRQRYANMTPEQRLIYNAKRREQYHRQSELSRQRRRERERQRYHSLQCEAAKDRNARRAKLERERYQKLTPEELESKNRKRRERAALARQKRESQKAGGASASVDTSTGAGSLKSEEKSDMMVSEAPEVVAANVKLEAIQASEV